MRKRIIASAYVMQDFGLGVNSKHGGGTQKHYFVCYHSSLKRGAFAGCSGGYTYRAQKNIEMFSMKNINCTEK